MTDYAIKLAAALAGVTADRVLSARFEENGDLVAVVDYGIAGGIKYRYAADQVKGVESGSLSVKHAWADSVEPVEKVKSEKPKAKSTK